MKYSEFAAFNKLLKVNGYNLNEWKLTPNLILLKEADELVTTEDTKPEDTKPEDTKTEDTKNDKLETKSSLKDLLRLSPRRALMRQKLNRNAKALQDSINKNINDKFIKPLVNQKTKFYQQVAEFAREKNTTADEVVVGMKNDIDNMQKIQNKQLEIIEKTAQTIIDSGTTKIKSAISKDLKETDAAEMLAYWAFLSAQIMTNLLNRIYKINNDALTKSIKDPKLAKTIEGVDFKTALQERDKYKKEVVDNKAKFVELLKKLETSNKELESSKIELKNVNDAKTKLDDLIKKANEISKGDKKSIENYKQIATDLSDKLQELNKKAKFSQIEKEDIQNKYKELQNSIKKASGEQVKQNIKPENKVKEEKPIKK